MKRILKQLHRYFYLLLVFLFFILLFPFVYLFSRNEKYYWYLNIIRKLHAFLSSAFSGFIYQYNFKSKIDWDQPYIICANHASNLDIFCLSLLCKNNFFFLGKEELLNNPVTALYFKTIDIPVNRESKISAFKAFKKSEEKLKQGLSLIIFPEGKIGDEYPPLLHSFKNGPFKLAIALKIPILPVSIENSWKLMWDDGISHGSRPGIANITIHNPIDTSNFTVKDEENLKNKVYEIVHSALDYDRYQSVDINIS